MTKEQKQATRESIERFLHARDSFRKDEVVQSIHPDGCSVGQRRDVLILLNKAREALVGEGIVFAPRGGLFVRTDWAGIVRQADRQRRAGHRKRVRSQRKLRIAAELAPGDQAQRISDAADREALRIAMSRRRRFDGA